VFRKLPRHGAFDRGPACKTAPPLLSLLRMTMVLSSTPAL
jgi:hypothetical protein